MPLDAKSFDFDVFGFPNLQIENFNILGPCPWSGKDKGQGKQQHQLQPQQVAPRSLPGSAWERPLGKAAALEQAAAVARRAGARHAEALAAEAKDARAAAQAAKPVHVRRGRVRDRRGQAEVKEAQAKDAAEQAQARYAQAVAHTATVREELTAVEAEVTQVPTAAENTTAGQALRTGVQALLVALERLNLFLAEHPSQSQLEVMLAMQRLHAAANTTAAAEGEANQMRQNLKAAMDEAARMPLQTDGDDFKDAGDGGGVTAGMLLGQMLWEAAAKSSSDAEFGAMAREVLRTGPY